MSQLDRAGFGPRALKTAGIVLLGIAGFFLMMLVLLYCFAEPLVERYLKQQVTEQTDGLYQVSFEDLQLHLRTRSITLQGLHFYPDTTVHRRQKNTWQASRTLLDVQSPKLKLISIKLLDLLFRKRLRIVSVVAERPVITQLLDESVEKANERGGKSRGSMKAVYIQRLALQDASYRYRMLGQQSRPQHEIPQLSLQVQDLRLDLQAQEDIARMLQADAVKLDLRNYTYQSPDSVYAIRVGRLSYSSGQRLLRLQNIAVRPDLRANAALPKNQAYHLVFQFSTPLLYMRGLDVAAAWRTKQLQIDRLLLKHPALQVIEDLTVPDTASLPGLANLYASLSPYLREIGVKELRLTDGAYSYRQKNGVVHTIHRLEQADLHLQALQLDSATLFTPKEKAFTAAISIAAETYTYTPRHSPYTLKTGSIKLSTRDRTLQAEALHLTGDWSKNDSLKKQNKAKRAMYDVSLPRLLLRDLDLLQALQTSRLAVGSITAEHPVIAIRTDRLVKVQDTGPGLQELYRQLSVLVNRLEVGKISITDASLSQHSKTNTIQLMQQLEHASVTATGLVVDSAFIFNPDLKLPLQDLVVTAKKYRYRVPGNTYTFALSSLRYSTREKEFSARTVEVISSSRENDRQKTFANASRNLFDLSASTLRITGVDLVEALNTGRLEVDQVLLLKPDVAMLLDRTVAAATPRQKKAGDRIFNLLEIISVNTIRLEDGSFTFNEKLEPVMRTHMLEHVTGTVSGFQLTPAKLANLGEALPMQELTLLAKNYTYRSTDSLYVFRLDSVHYSSRTQEIVARTFTVNADKEVNERLKAEHPDLASRNLIDISAGRSLITGFNLIHAYATGQYHMSMLLLSEPRVTILQDHNVLPDNGKTPAGQDTIAAAGAVQPLSDMVTTLRVGRLEVEDGTFYFNILEDNIRISQTLAHVALAIDQLRLVSLEATDPLDIFDADDIGLRVQGYTFFTPDSLYALEVKEIRASMQNSTLSADSIRLRPLYSKEAYAMLFKYAHDRIDMAVPGMEMQGISLRALFNRQDIVAHRMLIRNPVVDIYRDNRLGIDPSRRPPTMQRALREAGLYVRLDTILVEKNRLVNTVVAMNGVKPGNLLLENIRMELYNVTNDTALIRRNNMVTVNASALFMGASILQARFQFQMDHPEDRYTYEGTLQPMDLTALNPLLENLMFIRVKSGRIDTASFSIASTSRFATGQVHFPYSNLKVELLNKHDPENPSFLLKVESRLVNSLIIKTNNPSTWGKFREGEVEEVRDPQRSVSFHVSQAILDGVTHSLMTKLVYRIVSRFIDL
ncbi:hypothetical protein [Pontibacter litorisediminis]|uniref:hypothetical protein n=1 Tax=Pontibacter litorisediminis TaxID=1846260 RepID=UPI0023EB3A49|nr:hypothetical protein [Pontibacter litorisediminis]